MSDPSAELQAAIRAALKASAPAKAAVGSSTVKVYDVPPVNVSSPYYVIGQDDVADVPAEGKDLRETEVTIHCWSLMDPPGLAQVKAMGAAAQDVVLSLGDLTSFSVRATEFVRSRYRPDADGKSAHGVVQANVTTEPI